MNKELREKKKREREAIELSKIDKRIEKSNRFALNYRRYSNLYC